MRSRLSIFHAEWNKVHKYLTQTSLRMKNFKEKEDLVENIGSKNIGTLATGGVKLYELEHCYHLNQHIIIIYFQCKNIVELSLLSS